MNRQNFLGHLMLALALVALAAFAGQIRRWQHHTKGMLVATSQTVVAPQVEQIIHSEVLVRFRPGASPEAIKTLTRQFNDRIEDNIEAVDGLSVIEDEDGESAEYVANEYRSMT